MPVREGKAQWQGNLKQGNGTVAFSDYTGPYSFPSRFEEGEGTNPEELIGAALAGCFSMALSNMLDQAGHTPQSVATTAQVTLSIGADGAFIEGINLICDANVPGISQDTFDEVSAKAKAGCPISKALAATPITLAASLTA